jgi:hypothetical protein
MGGTTVASQSFQMYVSAGMTGGWKDHRFMETGMVISAGPRRGLSRTTFHCPFYHYVCGVLLTGTIAGQCVILKE